MALRPALSSSLPVRSQDGVLNYVVGWGAPPFVNASVIVAAGLLPLSEAHSCTVQASQHRQQIAPVQMDTLTAIQI